MKKGDIHRRINQFAEARAAFLKAQALDEHDFTISMRLGDMSVIGPFRYSGLLVALVLGYLMWGDVPNALAWGGIALVVAAGLGLLQSERMRKQALLVR